MSDFETSDEYLSSDSEVDLAELKETTGDLANEFGRLCLDEFKITTVEEVQQYLAAQTKRASQVLGLRPGAAQLVLNLRDWNVGEATSYFVEYPAKAAESLGLNHSDFAKLTLCEQESHQRRPDASSRKKRHLGECPICLANAATHSMGCGHFVCLSCFKKHVEIHMIEERKLFSTRCPGAHDCQLLVTRDVVENLKDNVLLTQFDYRLAGSYISKHPDRFRHCPRPGCEYIAESQSRLAPEPDSKSHPVRCRCAQTFCFHCGLEEEHFAVPCNVASQWLAIVDHEQRSSLWISQNTKQCPQCSTQIQRSEGCNHMVCSSCRHEFCWVCSQPWAEHSGKSYYNCVKYNPEPSTSSAASTRSTTPSGVGKRQRERIDFYMARFDNHTNLAQLVENVTARAAHKVLSWAYVLMCVAVHNNNKLLLEQLVTDLGRDLEDTSARLRQRTEALTTFLMTTNWVMDQNVSLKV